VQSEKNILSHTQQVSLLTRSLPTLTKYKNLYKELSRKKNPKRKWLRKSKLKIKEPINKIRRIKVKKTRKAPRSNLKSLSNKILSKCLPRWYPTLVSLTLSMPLSILMLIQTPRHLRSTSPN